MSLDSRDHRASAIDIGLPWRALYPAADGTINANDRGFILDLLAMRFSPVTTSTEILQKPVDYALAGQQNYDFRKGKFSGRGLKHTFNE